MPLRKLIVSKLNSLNMFCEEPAGSQWVKTTCINPEHVDTNPSAGVNVDSGVIHCFSCGHSELFIKTSSDDPEDVEELLWQAKYNSYKVKEEVLDDVREFFLPPNGHNLDNAWRGISKELLTSLRAFYCNHGLFQGRYVFPCYSDSILKGYDARIVDDTAMATKAKWLRAKHMDVKSLVYPKDILAERFPQMEHICITEGVMDAVSYIEMGVPAIASFGLTPPNSNRINQLIAMGITKVTLAYDNDEAGLAGMVKVLPIYQEWFEIVPHPMVTMVNNSQYKDANEFLVGIRENGLKPKRGVYEDEEY